MTNYLFFLFEKVILHIIKLNNENKTYLKVVLKKLIDCKYIIEKDKDYIRKIIMNITNN